MAKIETQYATGRLPAPIPVAQEVLSVKAKLTLTAPQAQAANVLSFVVLPADCRIVDYVVSAADLDTGTTATLTFGTLNAGETAIDLALFTGNTIAQAGGIIKGTDTKALYDAIGAIPKTGADRKIGITHAAIAGGQAGAIEVELFYQAA